MATTATSAQGLLQSDGCPWASLTTQRLYRAAVDGLTDTDHVENTYRSAAQGSHLAAALQGFGFARPGFEIRVSKELERLVADAINNGVGSWKGYGWDVFHMSRQIGWEFCAANVLFGCYIGGEARWLHSALVDVGGEDELIVFGTAEEALGQP
jgi:hypothetical protein